MMPTTPSGTRTWRSSRPLGSVEPRTHLADRVGQPGDVAHAGGDGGDPLGGRGVSRSIRPLGVPLAAAARRRRSALAARIVGAVLDQRVGHGVQRGVLRRRGCSGREHARRPPGLGAPVERRRRDRRPARHGHGHAAHGELRRCAGRQSGRAAVRRGATAAAVTTAARRTSDPAQRGTSSGRRPRARRPRHARQAGGSRVLAPQPQRQRGGVGEVRRPLPSSAPRRGRSA